MDHMQQQNQPPTVNNSKIRSPRKSEAARSQAHRSQSSAPWDQDDDSVEDNERGRNYKENKRSNGSRQGSEVGNRSRMSAPWEKDLEASDS